MLEAGQLGNTKESYASDPVPAPATRVNNLSAENERLAKIVDSIKREVETLNTRRADIEALMAGNSEAISTIKKLIGASQLPASPPTFNKF